MTSQQPPSIQVEDDSEDEFEPLFSYSQTVDESEDEDVIITSALKRRPEITPAQEISTTTSQRTPVKKAVVDDDSWLDSPPKLPKLSFSVPATEDRTVQQLRQKRMELMVLQAQASGAIQRVEETARVHVQQLREAEAASVVGTPEDLTSRLNSPGSEATTSNVKEKIVLKVQNKAGNVQSIRIFTTDNFEKLFSMYARMVGAPLADLSFRFDGDQLSPNSTPNEHDLEDDDIIEVYNKSTHS